MSYDTKCHELAKVFLGDVQPKLDEALAAKLAEKLAQEIQDAIEAFLAFEVDA